MKSTSKLITFIFTFLALAASAYAQTPREELQQMVEQLQKTPNDNALREKIIVLATSLKPAPAIPEEAREPFVMGATVLKKASDPAGANKAVDLFTQALNIAPWFADAYYNRAIAREAAGQFEPAIDDLKFYLGFKLTDAERREAQDKIYALKAEAQLGSAKKAEQDKIASAEEAKRQVQQAKRDEEASGPTMIRIPGKNYEMGKYEVTQGEWKAIMGSNPSRFSNCGDTCPVEHVSWSTAQEFIQKLNAKSGRQYRLPSEAEWEYACFGGSQSEYCGGNDDNAVAWTSYNSNSTTHPVGQKQANGYGLYDMTGNVAEWMQDRYDNEHDWRAVRGGAWESNTRYSRATNRNGIAFESSGSGFTVGFRLARTLP